MHRWKDWLAQAERDLEHAIGSREHEWACFACQQGAEKAVKALILRHGGVGWGHSVLKLMESLPTEIGVPDDVLDAARRLDRHYLPPRYPNGFDAGKPADYYTARDAAEALGDAQRVVELCKRHLA